MSFIDMEDNKDILITKGEYYSLLALFDDEKYVTREEYEGIKEKYQLSTNTLLEDIQKLEKKVNAISELSEEIPKIRNKIDSIMSTQVKIVKQMKDIMSLIEKARNTTNNRINNRPRKRI